MKLLGDKEKDLNRNLIYNFCVMVSSYNAMNHVHVPLVSDLYVLLLLLAFGGFNLTFHAQGKHIFTKIYDLFERKLEHDDQHDHVKP